MAFWPLCPLPPVGRLCLQGASVAREPETKAFRPVNARCANGSFSQCGPDPVADPRRLEWNVPRHSRSMLILAEDE
jgi:hypothetical protein